MDRLDHIFDLQKALDQKLVNVRGLKGISFEEWIQKDCIAIISELGELLDEVNFKWWKNPHPLDMKSIREELIDVMHFLISMCIKAQITPEDLYQCYLAKNKENIDRQEGKSNKQGYLRKAD